MAVEANNLITCYNELYGVCSLSLKRSSSVQERRERCSCAACRIYRLIIKDFVISIVTVLVCVVVRPFGRFAFSSRLRSTASCEPYVNGDHWSRSAKLAIYFTSAPTPYQLGTSV